MLFIRKRYLFITILVFLISLQLGSCSPSGSELSGRIAGKDSKNPLSNVSVLLCKVKDNSVEEPVAVIDKKLSFTSDEKGNYKIAGVPDGYYILLIALPEERKATVDEMDKKEFHVNWPVMILNGKTGAMENVDFMDANGGIKSRPDEIDINISEGYYKGEKNKNMYIKNGCIISEQLGFGMEYVDGKPESIEIVKAGKITKEIQISGK